MPIEFVDATMAEIDAVAAEIVAREFAAGRPILDGVEGGTTLVTFAANFGLTEQPTPAQYFAFIVILLENAGLADARDVLHERMDWFVGAYATSAEPLAVADFIYSKIA